MFEWNALPIVYVLVRVLMLIASIVYMEKAYSIVSASEKSTFKKESLSLTYQVLISYSRELSREDTFVVNVESEETILRGGNNE